MPNPGHEQENLVELQIPVRPHHALRAAIDGLEQALVGRVLRVGPIIVVEAGAKLAFAHMTVAAGAGDEKQLLGLWQTRRHLDIRIVTRLEELLDRRRVATLGWRLVHRQRLAGNCMDEGHLLGDGEKRNERKRHSGNNKF